MGPATRTDPISIPLLYSATSALSGCLSDIRVDACQLVEAIHSNVHIRVLSRLFKLSGNLLI